MANDGKAYHAKKSQGDLGDLSGKQAVGKDGKAKVDKSKITGTIDSEEDGQRYLRGEREMLIRLLGMDEELDDPVIVSELEHPESLFNSLLREDGDELNANSARRTGKSHKIMCRMLMRWLHIPGYNGCMVRKYNKQIAKMLADPCKTILQEMLLKEIITEEVYKAITTTTEQLTYRGRKIIFASSQNPHNTFNLKAGTIDATNFHEVTSEDGKVTRRPNVHAQFVEFFIDEIVEAEDNMEISYEQQEAAHNRMGESLNRGQIAPFGRSGRVISASNPWDDGHPMYKDLEARLPVGRDYQTKDRHELSEKIIYELIGEGGSGKIAKTTIVERPKPGSKTNELVTTRILDGRGSYKTIPASRFNLSVQNEYARYFEMDIETGYVVFGGIHGVMAGTRHTYRKQMIPSRTNGMGIPYEEIAPMISNVYMGMDRGKNDLTTLTLSGFATRRLLGQCTKMTQENKRKVEKHPFVDYDLDHVSGNRYDGDSETHIDNILDVIEQGYFKYDLVRFAPYNKRMKIHVLVDPTATEFIDRMNEKLKVRPLSSIVVVQKAFLDKVNKDSIANRVDEQNMLFSAKKHYMNPDGMETMSLFQAYNDCMNEQNVFARDEKPGKNKYILDRINSREMARSPYKTIFPLIIK